MIPVTLKKRPDDFNTEVRAKGRNWLANKGIAFNTAPPKASDLPNYWSHSNKQLWVAYGGVCAYLAIYFEWVTGASSTDHFVAKSKNAGDAYEWSNYRLSCLGPNRNKSNFADVLDPIGLGADTFHINFLDGSIKSNGALPTPDQQRAQATITRLKLDSPDNRAMRVRRFTNYLKGIVTLAHIEDESPFLHVEIVRQGLVI